MGLFQPLIWNKIVTVATYGPGFSQLLGKNSRAVSLFLSFAFNARDTVSWWNNRKQWELNRALQVTWKSASVILSCYSKHQLHCLESFSLAGTLSLTKHSSALQVHSHQLKRRGSSQVLPMHPPSLSEDCQVQQTVPKRVVVLGSTPTGTKMRHSVTT